MQGTTDQMHVLRILIADDDGDICDLMLEVLNRAGFQAKAAYSAEKALKMCVKDGPFDIAISDLNMPNMDGAWLMRRIAHQFPDSLRIIITGQPDFNRLLSLLDHGIIHRVYQKPFPLERLVQMAELWNLWRREKQTAANRRNSFFREERPR